jgi:adenylate cyclase
MPTAKILAVDDEPDFELLIRQHFRRQIRAGEYDFQFARDGAEALRAIAADPEIELVLSDINMPVMDGLTLLADLAKRPSGLRAVIVSAYGDMSNIRAAMNRGAFDFVTKPIDLADLDVTIRKTLAEIARLREIRQQRDDAQRMRSNLARYFSPNVVELLAAQDEPLGPVRRQNVAVLFADIVGFTRLAETMPPEEVMETLRVFHGRRFSPVAARSKNSSATQCWRPSACPTRRSATPAMPCIAPNRCWMRYASGMMKDARRASARSAWALVSATGRSSSAISAASMAWLLR